MQGMAQPFTESVVEQTALACLKSLGYTIKHGLEIAPGELLAERIDFRQLALEQRQRDELLPNLLSGEVCIPSDTCARDGAE